MPKKIMNWNVAQVNKQSQNVDFKKGYKQQQTDSTNVLEISQMNQINQINKTIVMYMYKQQQQKRKKANPIDLILEG